MATINELLTDAQIKAIRAPIADARWLPNSAFTSEQFFRAEADAVFAAGWMSLGFASEAPDPGDAHPVSVLGGIPLVMVRDAAGTLRVFHNVCPHDGCLAVWSDTKGLSRIRGNYHGWIWNLDGTLRSATLFDGTDVDHTNVGHDADLIEVTSAVWNGVVFVNIGGTAGSFADYIAPVEELYPTIDWDGVEPGMTPEGERVFVERFTFDSNWKGVYENFAINVYHEAFVHRGYQMSSNVPRVTAAGEKTYEEIDDRGYQGLCFSEAEADLAYGLARTPAMPTLDGQRLQSNTIMSLYPNTNISVYPNYVLITVLVPHGPNCTDYDSIMLHRRDVATEARWSEQRRYLLTDDWANARAEDAAVLRSVQAGRRSPAFDQHFYAPFWEGMVYSFNNRILDDLERNLPSE